MLRFDTMFFFSEWNKVINRSVSYSRCEARGIHVLWMQFSTKFWSFLAHLSRRLIWWAYRIVRPPSSVVVVCRRPHSLNIFSSETTGPIKVKFHMELLWDGGTKVCSNVPGHMTKMAAMAIYGKNLKKHFSGTKRPMTFNLGMHHRVLEYYQVCSNDDPGLTLTYFTAKSNWSLMLLYGIKVKQWIFQKLLSSMIWNWQQMTEVTRSFRWHQNFVPCGAVWSCLGAIYMY